MYRELLTPYLKEYTYAVLQEPCSEETIRETEKAVGLPFPEELKTLLRETTATDGFCFQPMKLRKTRV